MINLAVFGAGRMGAVHARNAAAHPAFNLVAICDPVQGPHLDALSAQTGAKIAHEDDIFADATIDAVLIASSTNTHSGLLVRAAQTGKAVFCEKPISLDFDLVMDVTRVVEEAGIPCMLGFQRRYDRSFRALRDRIASGAAGRLEHLTMQSRDQSPPPRAYVETSGGMFRDSTIHDFDMTRFLMDEEIATLYAVGSCLISPEIGAAGDIDTLMVTLTTVSGRMAQITACRRGPMGFDQRLQATCENEFLSIEHSPDNVLTIATPDGLRSAPPLNYFLERYEIAYKDELDAFAAYLNDGTPPLAGIRDGLEAQRLSEAAIVSMTTGQPVHLSPDWHPDQGAA